MRVDEKPEGYYIAVHKSLIDPFLMAGVPTNFFIMLGTMAMSIGVMLKMYWFIPISFVLFFIVRHFTKKDPQFFESLLAHFKDKRYFDV